MKTRKLGPRFMQSSVNSNSDAALADIRNVAIGEREVTLLIRNYDRLADDKL